MFFEGLSQVHCDKWCPCLLLPRIPVLFGSSTVQQLWRDGFKLDPFSSTGTPGLFSNELPYLNELVDENKQGAQSRWGTGYSPHRCSPFLFSCLFFHFTVSVLQVLATHSHLHCSPLTPPPIVTLFSNTPLLHFLRSTAPQMVVGWQNFMPMPSPPCWHADWLMQVLCTLSQSPQVHMCIYSLCLEKETTVSLQLPTTSGSSSSLFISSSGMVPEPRRQECDMHIPLWMTFTPGC